MRNERRGARGTGARVDRVGERRADRNAERGERESREAPIGFELWGNGRWSIGPVSGVSVRSGLALRAAGPHVPIAPPTPRPTGLCLDLSLTVQRYLRADLIVCAHKPRHAAQLFSIAASAADRSLGSGDFTVTTRPSLGCAKDTSLA